VKKRVLLPIILSLTVSFLSACSVADDGELKNLRTKLRDTASEKYRATVTAIFPAREAEFLLDYSYSKESGGRITVIKPDEVSGVSLTVSEEGSKLTFDGARLEVGRLDAHGLTPFTALPSLAASWVNGAWLEAGNTKIFGENAIMAITSAESADEKTEYRTWFSRSDLSPLYAEIYSDGERVITCKFERAENT